MVWLPRSSWVASTKAESPEKDEERSRLMGEPECCERRCSILVRSMVLDAGRFVPSLAARIVTSSCDSTRCDASLRVRVVDSQVSVR